MMQLDQTAARKQRNQPEHSFMDAGMWSTVRKRPWGMSPNSSERGGGISSSDGSSPPGSGNRLGGRGRIPVAGGGLALNRMVCDFSDLDDIGGGDFGLVTAATYDVDKQRYAIKSLRKPVTGEIDLQRRLQEVYAISACRCPHLLRYYDSWFEDGIIYLQTEFLNGGSILKRELPWQEDALWDLLRQVAIGLQAMHTANMAHLDIKPDNILMSPCETQPFGTIFKIGDFGLARPINTGSDVGEHFSGINEDEGDCRYLCPVFLAHGVSSGILREADMYSLGASIVHLTGGDPRARQPHYETLDVYSPLLQNMVYALISPNPSERPSAADVVELCQQHLKTMLAPPPEFEEGDAEVAALREELAALEAVENELNYRIACQQQQ